MIPAYFVWKGRFFPINASYFIACTGLNKAVYIAWQHKRENFEKRCNMLNVEQSEVGDRQVMASACHRYAIIGLTIHIPHPDLLH
jgi:hypothetical protein